MAVPAFVAALQDTSLAAYIRGDLPGSVWAFPVIETLHVMALATVYGTIAMVDARMLGTASRNLRLSKLTDELLPWTWKAFAVAALSGSLLFISKADTYWNNFEARAKFFCLALAGLNMLVYHVGMHRRIAEWDARLPPPTSVRVSGALSLALWTGVVFFGRWIGFTT